MMAEAQKIFDIARMFGFIVSEHKWV
jgi:hypothetical protein